MIHAGSSPASVVGRNVLFDLAQRLDELGRLLRADVVKSQALMLERGRDYAFEGLQAFLEKREPKFTGH